MGRTRIAIRAGTVHLQEGPQNQSCVSSHSMFHTSSQDQPELPFCVLRVFLLSKFYPVLIIFISLYHSFIHLYCIVLYCILLCSALLLCASICGSCPSE
jgi:hypothetical protein